MLKKTVILFKGRPYGLKQGGPNLIPLSLISLASPLKDSGFNVIIIDACKEDYKAIDDESWNDACMIGVSALTGNEISDGLDMARFARQKTAAPIVWGGWHVSMLPQESIKSSLVDIIVLGAGQNTIVELANAISSGESVSSVAGILFKDKGVVIKTRDRRDNLKSIGMPDFKSLDLEHYRKESMSIRHGHIIRGLEITGYLYYITSFGCPNKCTYCCNRSMFGSKMLFYDIDSAVDQIEWLVNHKGFNSIGFMDANFFANMARVKYFCEKIVERGVKFVWDAQMYAGDIIKYEKNGIMQLICDSGCFRVNVGVESGSQKILNYIKKIY